MNNSILVSNNNACADAPATTAAAVSAALGYNCGKTSGELGAILMGTGPVSLRGMTPFQRNAPLAQDTLTPYAFPLPMILSGGKQMTQMRSVATEISLFDLLMNPAPIQADDFEIGTDPWNPHNVPIVLGLADIDNFPIIQVNQYSGNPGQGLLAWETVVPLLGVVVMVSWTQNDDNSNLIIGRRFINVPNSETEIARIVPQDENCRQLSFFMPFTASNFESIGRGTVYMRYLANDYLRHFNPGDDFISANPSLMPWTVRVEEGGVLKTSGYSWNVQTFPVPLTASVVQKFWPAWNGRQFAKS